LSAAVADVASSSVVKEPPAKKRRQPANLPASFGRRFTAAEGVASSSKETELEPHATSPTEFESAYNNPKIPQNGEELLKQINSFERITIDNYDEAYETFQRALLYQSLEMPTDVAKLFDKSDPSGMKGLELALAILSIFWNKRDELIEKLTTNGFVSAGSRKRKRKDSGGTVYYSGVW
jgi:hypothetical protein